MHSRPAKAGADIDEASGRRLPTDRKEDLDNVSTQIHNKSIPDKSINETLKFDTLKATSYMVAEQRFTEYYEKLQSTSQSSQ